VARRDHEIEITLASYNTVKSQANLQALADSTAATFGNFKIEGGRMTVYTTAKVGNPSFTLALAYGEATGSVSASWPKHTASFINLNDPADGFNDEAAIGALGVVEGIRLDKTSGGTLDGSNYLTLVVVVQLWGKKRAGV
jgi:hypothetical protein